MTSSDESSGLPASQEVLQESKAQQQRTAIKESIHDDRLNASGPITDQSRALRLELGSLCEQYNALLADKDALDFRLGTDNSYDDGTMSPGGAKRAYEHESKSTSAELRTLIVKLVEIAAAYSHDRIVLGRAPAGEPWSGPN